ncbi:MAG: aminotransferase class III-fold pyridoxal phosphate-dependent enzyme [Pseudonocardiaceae bacterium]|nr:aminotransferase class III-fold pyridoxal phosphate-dependent enzyme [Pseudonocardiaceae bacterium]
MSTAQPAGEPAARGALLPVTARELPIVERGAGVYLYAEDGRRYLDGSSGAVAANLGHGNETIAEALAEQARTVAFAHRTQFRSRPAEQLAALVGEHAPGELRWSLFSSSGSEANELALRIAMAYWAARGKPEKVEFVSRSVSYHGSTLGALSLTGQPRRRAGAEALLHGFARLHTPVPDAGSVADLRAELQRLDPRGIAAVVTEPIGGASSGAVVPPEGYYEHLRGWCDAHDVLWIADEVMCGFGRTGQWFAVQHWDAVPDVLVFGKGVSGGYGPLAGIVCGDRIAEPVLTDRGFVDFGHTYSNAPIGAALGLAVVREMRRHRLVERAGEIGTLLRAELDAVAGRHPIVHQRRGLGLLHAIELACPPSSQPFPAEHGLTQRLLAAARAEGLLLYPAVQGVRNGRGDGVLIAPPLIITAAEVGELARSLDAALGTLEESLDSSGPERS